MFKSTFDVEGHNYLINDHSGWTDSKKKLSVPEQGCGDDTNSQAVNIFNQSISFM